MVEFEFYDEKNIIKWFMESSFVHLLLEELEIQENYNYQLNTIQPFYYTHNEGDIDLLLYSFSKPKETIAAQCKTIHVNVKSSQKEKANVVKRIDELVNQSNEMFKLGFFKTFLILFIQADCRNRKAGNVFFMTGITKETYAKLNKRIKTAGLNSNIGIIFVIYSQFANKSIEESGSISVETIRAVTTYPQWIAPQGLDTCVRINGSLT
jgi:hypothetical protein